MNIDEILEKVQKHAITLDEAKAALTPYTLPLGEYAKIDTDRKSRTGFAEVIFAEGKTNEHLIEIFRTIKEREGEVLATRASLEQYNLLRQEFPVAKYHKLARIIIYQESEKELQGKIAVLSAGSSDLRVAEEAATVAEFFGTAVTRLYDVGISSLHRLLANLDQLAGANAIVAVAGMEGALASVVAGLVKVPVIAVPTSIGYGANFGGVSALLTMLNSCSNGICTVNIDNGFGAGYLGAQINRLAIGGVHGTHALS